MDINDIISRLDNVQQVGDSYTAHCPSHDDRHNSLSISQGDKKIILHCHAGCGFEEIIKALDIDKSDLYYEKAKQKEQPLLNGTRPEAEYIYKDENGKAIHKTIRYGKQYDRPFLQARFEDGKWKPGLKGIETVIYKLPEVINAVKNNTPIFIVEGEKDVENLFTLGFTATTNPMGAGKWKEHYSKWLKGSSVYIIPDNDEAGKSHLSTVVNNLKDYAKEIRVIYLDRELRDLMKHGDITDYLRQVCNGEAAGQNEVRRLMDNAVVWNDSDEWEEPIPFDSVIVPDFPVNAFPDKIAQYVKALSDSTQTPQEMAGVLILGVLATAMQGRYIIKINSDYSEPLNLYTVAIAPPGERKSKIIGSLTAPIRKYEKIRNMKDAEAVSKSQSTKKRLKKKLDTLEDRYAKGKATDEEVDEAVAEFEKFKELYHLRLIADDTTPEKLINLMTEQNGRLTISSSEGGIFDSLCGRYDKSSNIDPYLKAHAGDSIRVDRIGRAPDHIDNPSLSMILTIQPEVLAGLVGNTAFRGKGLVGRFQYAVCKSMLGHRNVTPPPIPEGIKDEYESLIINLLDRKDEGIIKLSPEADKAYIEYAKVIEKRLGNEWEYMRDYGGKAMGAMLRIAGLLHGTTNYEPAAVQVSADTIKHAVMIMECLSKHAETVYLTMGKDESINEAKYVLKRIKESEQDSISKRDLLRLCSGHYKTVDELEPTLKTLIDMNYIKEEEIKSGDKGRPSKKIILNPLNKNDNNDKNRKNTAENGLLSFMSILSKENGNQKINLRNGVI